MPLCLSATTLLAAWLGQPALELRTPQQVAALKLNPGGSCAVQCSHSAKLQAGTREVVWRPDVAALRAGEADLALRPAEGGSVDQVAVENGRIRWRVSVRQSGRYVLVVSAPLHDATWSVHAKAILQHGRLVWQPHVTIKLSKGGPFSADRVIVRPSADTDAGEELGPVVLRDGEVLEVPVPCRYETPVQLVHRYETGWASARIVALIDGPEAAATFGRWTVSDVHLRCEASAPRTKATIRLSPDRDAEIELGPSRAVVVRRTLLEERRENLDFDRFGRVQGYDTIEEIRIQVLNVGAETADVEVVEDLPSAWEIKADPPPDTTWPDKAVIRLRLQPGQAAEHTYVIIKHSGTRIP